jgi:hypothetical protein
MKSELFYNGDHYSVCEIILMKFTSRDDILIHLELFWAIGAWERRSELKMYKCKHPIKISKILFHPEEHENDACLFNRILFSARYLCTAVASGGEGNRMNTENYGRLERPGLLHA